MRGSINNITYFIEQGDILYSFICCGTLPATVKTISDTSEKNKPIECGSYANQGANERDYEKANLNSNTS